MSILSASLSANDFPAFGTLELNIQKALEEIIPVQKEKDIKKFYSLLENEDLYITQETVDKIDELITERASYPYQVKEVRVENKLSSIYVNWFHTDDDQKANDIYIKISSLTRTYEYYCYVIYNKQNYHVAGCNVLLNGKTMPELIDQPIFEIYMRPLEPLYSGFVLDVYIDKEINHSLCKKKDFRSNPYNTYCF